MWVNSHSTSYTKVRLFTVHSVSCAESNCSKESVFTLFPSLFFCPAFLCAFPDSWIEAYTLSFMVPYLLLEQWRLSRTWVLNKRLEGLKHVDWELTAALWQRQEGWELRARGQGHLKEGRQVEGAPWEIVCANNHNNTSTRVLVFQHSQSWREK